MSSNNICIIPIRKNSKSVKNKNIKNFMGKPLVFHVIEKSIKAGLFKKIIISTDSKKYINLIKKKFRNKVSFFLRSKKSSTDQSKTEEAINEIINFYSYLKFEVIFLVQATSPLINQSDLKNAFRKFKENKLDSLFTSYKSKKFVWRDKNGSLKSLNYNFKRRPMKQKFKSNYVENGAFYIFKLKNFQKYNNRLNGKIGTYVMPKERSLDIDTKNDFK